MTFFVKMSAFPIYKKVRGLNTEFEYFLKCPKLHICAANFVLKICLINNLSLKN